MLVFSSVPSHPHKGANLSPRDLQILALVRTLLGRDRGAPMPSFAEVLRAMTESVQRVIPAGRVFHLGHAKIGGPILGSQISGVGVTESSTGVLIVRLDGRGLLETVGPL